MKKDGEMDINKICLTAIVLLLTCRELPYWFTDGFGPNILRGEKYYFIWGETEPLQGQIEMNIEKLRKLKIFNLNMFLAILDGNLLATIARMVTQKSITVYP